MKLKKVLSLALAGMMAMSMLTACGSGEEQAASSGSDDTSIAINTTIVEKVESKVKSGRAASSPTISVAQYELLPFTGNETKDMLVAQNVLTSANNAKTEKLSDNATTVSDLSGSSFDLSSLTLYTGNGTTTTTADKMEAGKTYVAVVSTSSADSVDTIATALFNIVKTVVTKTGTPLIDTMTVGGVAVSVTDNTYYNYDLNSAGYTTGFDTYAIVVFTTAADGTSSGSATS